MTRLLCFALLSVACGGSNATSSESTVVVAPAAAVTPTVADADAAALGLGASIDPSRGLVVVARIEDASDGEAPPMITSGHRCAQQDIDQVAAMLSDYVSERRGMGEPVLWSCAGTRCELRGMMEYDPTRALRFGRNAAGTLVVVGIDFFEDVGSGEEFVMELRRQVDAEHLALLGPCP